MEIVYLKDLGTPFKVPVHQADCQEVGQVIALEVSKHFDHPVHHAGSKCFIHRRMPIQTSCGEELCLNRTEVVVHILSQLIPNVHILSFDVISLDS